MQGNKEEMVQRIVDEQHNILDIRHSTQNLKTYIEAPQAIGFHSTNLLPSS